jgi:hypothetical protein
VGFRRFLVWVAQVVPVRRSAIGRLVRARRLAIVARVVLAARARRLAIVVLGPAVLSVRVVRARRLAIVVRVAQAAHARHSAIVAQVAHRR